MKPNASIPIMLFAGGVACMIAAVMTGEAEISMVLIFPIFSGSSGLFILGVMLILFSFVAGFVMLASSQIALSRSMLHQELGQESLGQPEMKKKYGGIVLIGPVPIAFGSDMKWALAMLVIGVILAIVALALIVYFT